MQAAGLNFRASEKLSRSDVWRARRAARYDHLVEPNGNLSRAPALESNAMIESHPPESVDVRTLAPRRVAALRHTGPYMEIGQTFERLMQWAGRRGLIGPDTEMLAVFYDDAEQRPPEQLRSDACIAVPDEIEGDGDVVIQTIEGGEYAVALHRGPYHLLPTVYRWIYSEWLVQNGRRPRALPPYEIYRNDPSTTKPDDLLTEVYVPLT